MFVIHKFPIDAGSGMIQEIKLSGKLYSFLKVDMQNNVPMVWATIDQTKPKETVKLRIIVTGMEFDPSEFGAYIGTFQRDWFVGHLWEVL